MKNVHKGNVLVVWICSISLTLTTFLGYGLSAKMLYGGGVLLGTAVLTTIIYNMNVSYYAKALCIVLMPAYAILLYSLLVGGNSIAFMASFISLGMAVRYFDRKLIQYYAVPYVIAVCLCVIVRYQIIDVTSASGAVAKVVIFVIACVLVYMGTAYGEDKIEEAKEMLRLNEENKSVATSISDKLDSQIDACSEEVIQVTSQAELVKESTNQMTQVAEETSNSIIRISEKVSAANKNIEKNYNYASELEKSFADVDLAVSSGNREAVEVQETMGTMSQTVTDAKQSTEGLLEQMQTITKILDEINAIAAQTNLLSLNASIEAARAGEHGRGFAVVANEIRTLSENSTCAAKNIQNILGSLTEVTKEVAGKITDGVDACQVSQDKINNLLNVLENISQSAESASKVVKDEYDIIEIVKEEFDEIQEELETVVATSEENSAMIVTINDSIVAQTESVEKLSDTIGIIKETSHELNQHFTSKA
ncbi:MAG: methyl-accepting chemotaxis protein [bacterium]|nr:methyl-accepting chemotaxis protein [bacterium]